jgi:hypothetical protein
MLETLYEFILSIFSYLSFDKLSILYHKNNQEKKECENSEILLQYDEIYSIENPFYF